MNRKQVWGQVNKVYPEGETFRLIVKITDGPETMLDRKVTVYLGKEVIESIKEGTRFDADFPQKG